MFDYALVQLLGRATSDASFSKSDDGRITKAIFTMACNIPIQRNDEKVTKTVFRRVMVLGSYAKYVFNCQEEDGLKGRLINVVGVMDDERYIDEKNGAEQYREVARIAPGSGFIKVMDRPATYDD